MSFVSGGSNANNDGSVYVENLDRSQAAGAFFAYGIPLAILAAVGAYFLHRINYNVKLTASYLSLWSPLTDERTLEKSLLWLCCLAVLLWFSPTIFILVYGINLYISVNHLLGFSIFLLLASFLIGAHGYMHWRSEAFRPDMYSLFAFFLVILSLISFEMWVIYLQSPADYLSMSLVYVCFNMTPMILLTFVFQQSQSKPFEKYFMLGGTIRDEYEEYMKEEVYAYKTALRLAMEEEEIIMKMREEEERKRMEEELRNNQHQDEEMKENGILPHDQNDHNQSTEHSQIQQMQITVSTPDEVVPPVTSVAPVPTAVVPPAISPEAIITTTTTTSTPAVTSVPALNIIQINEEDVQTLPPLPESPRSTDENDTVTTPAETGSTTTSGGPVTSPVDENEPGAPHAVASSSSSAPIRSARASVDNGAALIPLPPSTAASKRASVDNSTGASSGTTDPTTLVADTLTIDASPATASQRPSVSNSQQPELKEQEVSRTRNGSMVNGTNETKTDDATNNTAAASAAASSRLLSPSPSPDLSSSIAPITRDRVCSISSLVTPSPQDIQRQPSLKRMATIHEIPQEPQAVIANLPQPVAQAIPPMYYETPMWKLVVCYVAALAVLLAYSLSIELVNSNFDILSTRHVGWITSCCICVVDLTIFACIRAGRIKVPLEACLWQLIIRLILVLFGEVYWFEGHAFMYCILSSYFGIDIVNTLIPDTRLKPLEDDHPAIATWERPQELYEDDTTFAQANDKISLLLTKYISFVSFAFLSVLFIIDLLCVAFLSHVPMHLQEQHDQYESGVLALFLTGAILTTQVLARMYMNRDYRVDANLLILLIAQWILIVCCGIFIYFLTKSIIVLVLSCFLPPTSYLFIYAFFEWKKDEFQWFSKANVAVSYNDLMRPSNGGLLGATGGASNRNTAHPRTSLIPMNMKPTIVRSGSIPEDSPQPRQSVDGSSPVQPRQSVDAGVQPRQSIDASSSAQQSLVPADSQPLSVDASSVAAAPLSVGNDNHFTPDSNGNAPASSHAVPESEKIGQSAGVNPPPEGGENPNDMRRVSEPASPDLVLVTVGLDEHGELNTVITPRASASPVMIDAKGEVEQQQIQPSAPSPDASDIPAAVILPTPSVVASMDPSAPSPPSDVVLSTPITVAAVASPSDVPIVEPVAVTDENNNSNNLKDNTTNATSNGHGLHVNTSTPTVNRATSLAIENVSAPPQYPSPHASSIYASQHQGEPDSFELEPEFYEFTLDLGSYNWIKRYKPLIAVIMSLILTFGLGLTITRHNQPSWVGYTIMFSLAIAGSTFLPVFQWLSTGKLTNPIIAKLVFAATLFLGWLLLLWLHGFSGSRLPDAPYVSNNHALVLLFVLIMYPCVVLFIICCFQYRMNRNTLTPFIKRSLVVIAVLFITFLIAVAVIYSPWEIGAGLVCAFVLMIGGWFGLPLFTEAYPQYTPYAVAFSILICIGFAVGVGWQDGAGFIGFSLGWLLLLFVVLLFAYRSHRSLSSLTTISHIYSPDLFPVFQFERFAAQNADPLRDDNRRVHFVYLIWILVAVWGVLAVFFLQYTWIGVGAHAISIVFTVLYTLDCVTRFEGNFARAVAYLQEGSTHYISTVRYAKLLAFRCQTRMKPIDMAHVLEKIQEVKKLEAQERMYEQAVVVEPVSPSGGLDIPNDGGSRDSADRSPTNSTNGAPDTARGRRRTRSIAPKMVQLDPKADKFLSLNEDDLELLGMSAQKQLRCEFEYDTMRQLYHDLYDRMPMMNFKAWAKKSENVQPGNFSWRGSIISRRRALGLLLKLDEAHQHLYTRFLRYRAQLRVEIIRAAEILQQRHQGRSSMA